MNSRIQNQICVASLVDGFMIIIEDEGSQYAAKLASRVRKRSNTVFANLPLVVSKKQVKAIERRIKVFEREVLQAKEHTVVCLLSVLLAMVDDIINEVNEKVPWLDLQCTLFCVHKHYDRKLNNFAEYAVAAKMAYRWRHFV